jgi:hypothetical protein
MILPATCLQVWGRGRESAVAVATDDVCDAIFFIINEKITQGRSTQLRLPFPHAHDNLINNMSNFLENKPSY